MPFGQPVYSCQINRDYCTYKECDDIWRSIFKDFENQMDLCPYLLFPSTQHKSKYSSEGKVSTDTMHFILVSPSGFLLLFLFCHIILSSQLSMWKEILLFFCIFVCPFLVIFMGNRIPLAFLDCYNTMLCMSSLELWLQPIQHGCFNNETN